MVDIDQDAARAAYKRLGNMSLLKTRIKCCCLQQRVCGEEKYYQTREFVLTKEIAKSLWMVPTEIDVRRTGPREARNRRLG